MANDEPDDDDKNPARAFAELRAEVTILRRAVEGLPEVIHSPTTGRRLARWSKR